MSATSHPWWYYEYFDQVFSRGSGYVDEAREILRRIPMTVQSVTEVGAGLGGHASALLQLGVRNLRLVDVDPTAATRLRRSFADHETVKVFGCDGFGPEAASIEKSDVSLCMYSVVQQASNQVEFERRVSRMIDLCRVEGVVAFECVDRERSLDVYPPGETSSLIATGSDTLEVCSHYPGGALEIEYRGVLQGEAVHYSVRLLGLTESDIVRVLRAQGMAVVSTSPLDDTARRRLFVASRA